MPAGRTAAGTRSGTRGTGTWGVGDGRRGHDGGHGRRRDHERDDARLVVVDVAQRLGDAGEGLGGGAGGDLPGGHVAERVLEGRRRGRGRVEDDAERAAEGGDVVGGVGRRRAGPQIERRRVERRRGTQRRGEAGEPGVRGTDRAAEHHAGEPDPAVHHPAGVRVREPGGELGAHLGDGDRRPARAVGRRVEGTAVDALEHQGALGALGEAVDVEHLDEVAVVQAREAADLLGAHDEVLAVHRGQRHHRDLAAQHRVEPARGGVDRAGTGVRGGGGRLVRIRRPHPLRRCTVRPGKLLRTSESVCPR